MIIMMDVVAFQIVDTNQNLNGISDTTIKHGTIKSRDGHQDRPRIIYKGKRVILRPPQSPQTEPQ